METVEIGAPAETTVTEVPIPDTSAPPPAVEGRPAPEAPKVEVKPDTRDRSQIIRDALNKPPTNRGKHAAYQPREQGKFVPGAPAIPAPAAPIPPELALPKSIKREYEAHWNQTPAELRQALIQREADYEKGINQYKTQAEQAQGVLEQFRPYEWMLRNEGATPQTAIAPLLQTAAILRTGTPAQKAQSVAQVMRQFGIPIEHIQAMYGQQNGQQSAVMDPQYNQLAQQVQHLTQAQQQQEQIQNQRAMSVIEQFAADPAHPHFAVLQPKMLALLQTPHLMGVDVQFMSEREKLKLAYETALRLDPQLSAQAAAQQQAEATRIARQNTQQAANVAKAAAVQVQGAPGAPLAATVNSQDRRSVIANALRAANT